MIECVGKCECGAVTATINGQDYSMPVSEFEGLYGALEDFSEVMLPQTWGSCNYCVNHWGTDLCACGSGEKADECDCEFDCNGIPMQDIEEGRTHYKDESSWI